MYLAGTVHAPRLLLVLVLAVCGMRLVDAAHHSEVAIQSAVASFGFLDLEGT
jgi:hypothetical protein